MKAILIPLCPIVARRFFYVKSDHDTGNNVKCRKESDCDGIMSHFQTGWVSGGTF